MLLENRPDHPSSLASTARLSLGALTVRVHPEEADANHFRSSKGKFSGMSSKVHPHRSNPLSKPLATATSQPPQETSNNLKRKSPYINPSKIVASLREPPAPSEAPVAPGWDAGTSQVVVCHFLLRFHHPKLVNPGCHLGFVVALSIGLLPSATLCVCVCVCFEESRMLC